MIAARTIYNLLRKAPGANAGIIQWNGIKTQPRDGDARAAFAIYDGESRDVELVRVEYDWKRTADKVRQAGLPRFLAERLMEGR